MIWWVTFAAAVLVSVGANAQPKKEPKDAAADACVSAAFQQFNAANMLLLQSVEMVMSPEQVIAQRRLQEQYCAKAALCTAGEPVDATKMVLYSLAFSSCVEEETLEHYQAVPKNN